jgi:hypothetical protein
MLWEPHIYHNINSEPLTPRWPRASYYLGFLMKFNKKARSRRDVTNYKAFSNNLFQFCAKYVIYYYYY